MNGNNVVLFDRPKQGGMARRGAPDKNGPSCARVIVFRCPSCGSDFCLEAGAAEGHAEVLCGRCETEIPISGEHKKSGVR